MVDVVYAGTSVGNTMKQTLALGSVGRPCVWNLETPWPFMLLTFPPTCRATLNTHITPVNTCNASNKKVYHYNTYALCVQRLSGVSVMCSPHLMWDYLSSLASIWC